MLILHDYNKVLNASYWGYRGSSDGQALPQPYLSSHGTLVGIDMGLGRIPINNCTSMTTTRKTG